MFPGAENELRVIRTGKDEPGLLCRSLASVGLLEYTFMVASLTTFARRAILRAYALHL